MCSSTLQFHALNVLKPTFFVDGVEVKYTQSNKYLGFLLNSALSSRDHMQLLLRKLRKSITIFNACINIRKRPLLLRFARTYIVSILHGLEFVPTVTAAQCSRFDFLMTKFFKLRTVQKFQNFRKKFEWLNLVNLQKAARKRYENDF